MKRDPIADRYWTHVWRPYTSSEEHEQLDPFVVARVEGSWLYDKAL